jgi:hypothetical protein
MSEYGCLLAGEARHTSFAALLADRAATVRPPSHPKSMQARFALVTALLLGPGIASGQALGYGPVVLQLPASARAVGFGNAYVAVREAEALFYNPANVGGRNLIAVSGERYGSEAVSGAFATSYVFGPAGIGIGAQLLDYRVAVPRYPELAPNGRQLTQTGPFQASSFAASVAFSMAFKGVRWGTAVKLAQDRVEATRDGVLLADVGAAREIGPVSLGLAVQNLGTSARMVGSSAALPTRATFGVSGGGLPVGPLDFAASAAVTVRRGGRVSPAGGGELSYVPIDGVVFAARLGARLPEENAELPVTLGASFGFDRLTLDYGFEPYHGPGNGHRIGLRVR